MEINEESALEQLSNLGDSEDANSEEPKEEANEEEANEEEEFEQENEEEEAEEEEGELTTLSELAEHLGVDEEQLMALQVIEKVNGQEIKSTIADLRASGMMEKDYRHKTSELAEQRRALEAERQAFKEQSENSVSEGQKLVQILEHQYLNAFNNIDWKELKEIDPEEYRDKKEEFREQQEYLVSAKQYLQQLEHAQQQEMMQRENQALLAMFPEWSDSQKRSEHQAKLTTYLLSNGYTNQDLSKLYDSRVIALANKAMQFDGLKKKGSQTRKALKLPKVTKPGKSATAKELKNQTRDEKMAKFKKTGDESIALQILEDLV